MKPTGATRKVTLAAKDHKCFAASCSGIIPKGEYYIADRLMATLVAPTGTRTLMTLAWHMGCAPLTRPDMMRELMDSYQNQSKHPSRTGAEHADA